MFKWNPETEWVDVAGYVDPDSVACRDADGADPAQFAAANGFHPDQCASGAGVLQYDRDVILDYIREGDAAGFTMHIHSDRRPRGRDRA